MTPERWQQINKLLQQVVDISRDEQSARLEELCPDDPDLRGEVESLISFQEQAKTFMELPAVEENLYLLCITPPSDLAFTIDQERRFCAARFGSDSSGGFSTTMLLNCCRARKV